MERSTEEFKRGLCAAIAHDRDVQKAILDVFMRSIISNPESRSILGQSSEGCFNQALLSLIRHRPLESFFTP